MFGSFRLRNFSDSFLVYSLYTAFLNLMFSNKNNKKNCLQLYADTEGKNGFELKFFVDFNDRFLNGESHKFNRIIELFLENIHFCSAERNQKKIHLCCLKKSFGILSLVCITWRKPSYLLSLSYF